MGGIRQKRMALEEHINGDHICAARVHVTLELQQRRTIAVTKLMS